MKLRVRMKDGTRWIGSLPVPFEDLLRAMQSQRVIAFDDEDSGLIVILSTDAISAIEVEEQRS
jgi:hypothetical protein